MLLVDKSVAFPPPSGSLARAIMLPHSIHLLSGPADVPPEPTPRQRLIIIRCNELL